ncbi:flippase [Acinetobacter ursingii]|uniref:flippase n=1 Tax=Acinetobacter ursingii TaxID=108980 RepID=UPI003AF61173
MSIAKNSFINIAGYLVPGVLSIPVLGYMARAMGGDLFGLFTLILSIVGYASIFDVGISRSVIREVAIYRHDSEEVLKILSTSTVVMLFLGVLAGTLIIIFDSYIVDFLNVSLLVSNDFHRALILMSISIPFFLLVQVYCSLLEGHLEFLKLSIFKTISSSLIVAMPAMMLLWNVSLYNAVLGLLIARIISFLLIIFYCKKYITKKALKFYKLIFYRLVKFGGWVAVSNIISPIISYFDRFILSNKMGSGLVGFYSAPSEAISRLSILPVAVAKTIFPMLSRGDVDKKNTKKISYLLICLSSVPLGLLFIYFGREIITLWLGHSYAEKSTLIFQILMLGFIFNAIAQIPFTSIQAKGNAKITSLIQVAECVPYIFLLLYLIDLYGLVGVAIAWTTRVLVDLLLLMFFDRFE